MLRKAMAGRGRGEVEGGQQAVSHSPTKPGVLGGGGAGRVWVLE